MEKQVAENYGSVDRAIEIAQRICQIPIVEDRLIQYIYTTLGADLSDMLDASTKLIRSFETISRATSAEIIADVLTGEVQAQLDYELIWHALNATVKIDLLQFGLEGGDNIDYMPMPNEIEEHANTLGKAVNLSVNNHLKEINQEEILDESDKDELIALVYLTYVTNSLILTVFENEDPTKYIGILNTLSKNLEELIRVARDTVQLREQLSDLLFPEPD